MKLYHGSTHIIETPTFGAGNPHNDYGPGFYCTESLKMASEWAVGSGVDGYANEYAIDMEGLSVVNLGCEEFCTLHWLSVLLANRTFDVRAPLALEAREYLLENFGVDLGGVDIVKGYRADDSYFAFAQDFITGVISYRQLQNAMKLGRLGRQVVVKSEEAFSRLEFKGAAIADSETWLPKRTKRDRKARSDYFDIERSRRKRGDLYITQILDERMVFGDARL